MVALLILLAMVAYANAVEGDVSRLSVMYPHTTQAEAVHRAEPLPVTTRFGVQFGGVR